MAARLDIRISKESHVPIRDQLAEQIAFLVATGELKPGDILPSVRTLARQLKIHHNTVSQAYHDLVDRSFLQRRRGSRMAVRPLEEPAGSPRVEDLDDLINATISKAQEHGYTLQQLRQRVRERLMAQPPDHVLVVADEPGLRKLIREELKKELHLPVEACASSDIPFNRGLVIGALVVCHEGVRRHIAPLLPKDLPFFTIRYSSAEEHMETVRSLREPSIIAVVSVSEALLQTARGVLAPVLGNRHTIREYLWPAENPRALRAADIVFCDAITCRQVKARRLIHYRLVPPEFLVRLSAAFKS
jgi:DNA-binding transcriptional regulator YhcF (GntR family)